MRVSHFQCFTYGWVISNRRGIQKTLQTFYGVGPSVSRSIMARFHIHPMARVGSLVDKQVLELNAELSTMKIENDLRRQVQGNIKRLRDMGTYIGKRHAMGLPVRGQRTRSQVCDSVNLQSGITTALNCKCRNLQQ